MANVISDEIRSMVKDLIKQVSSKEENSPQFNALEKYAITEIKNSSSMNFSNKKQITEDIYSMSDKFVFHGFPKPAEYLKPLYHLYIPENLPTSELMNRLNVVKFLLCMSDRPTMNFLLHPERYCIKEDSKEEDIDWKTYLLEDCEKYHLQFNQSSDSSDLSSNDESEPEKNETDEEELIQQTTTYDSETSLLRDLKDRKEALFFNVQQMWYNQINTIIEADSRWFQASVAVLWEQHLNEQVNGLIPLTNLVILPEYYVMREIFWQLWEPHDSIVFNRDSNRLKMKSYITVPSVRAIAFQSFITKFITYIELMEFFHKFMVDVNSIENRSVSETYRSYCKSLNSIITPVCNRIIQLERLVQAQETTFTLLQLSRQFEEIFEPLIALKRIHNEVILDYKSNTAAECAANLLARLYNSIHKSCNKLEQDLKMALFFDSIYYYFTLIESWLINDQLIDPVNEFVISLCAEDRGIDNVKATDLSVFCKENALIKIILHEILPIGKNIHLLRLLGKYNLINDVEETIHQEFVRKCLLEINSFFEVNSSDEKCDERKDEVVLETTNEFKELVEDALLLADFTETLPISEKRCENQPETLFEIISRTTTSLFPVERFLERVFKDVLKERFTVSGLMMKTVLIEQYKLDVEFQFLRHMYLFYDDVLFGFYVGFFEKIANSKYWGNKLWLTSQLQDIIMDLYPDFHENCSVDIKDNWIVCTDSLNACNLINIQHNINWPLDLIITNEQMDVYKEIFEFLLKLKWALHTINRLNFNDINSDEKTRKMSHKNYENNLVVKKLIHLRFSLINVLNSIQHYIFGFIFAACLLKFELDFEKSSDLNSIQETHRQFINSIYVQVKEVRDCGDQLDGCNVIFDCVKQLNRMWKNKRFATLPKLDECFNLYNKAFSCISEVINSHFVHDY